MLATDGIPQGCITFGDNLAPAVDALSKGAMQTPSIPTYVIGVFSDVQVAESKPALEKMATAGGTGMPFILTTGDDLTQKFQAALDQIRGAALGCEFDIPKPNQGTLDYNKVNVHYKGPQGEKDLGYVGDMSKCDPGRGGWYYDVDPKSGTPKRVLLCPSTCTEVQANKAASQVQLRFGCQTKVE